MDKRFKSFGLNFTPEVGDLLYYQKVAHLNIIV